MVSQRTAVKAEAQETVVTFEYNGQSYTVDRDVDIDVLEDIEAGKTAAAVRGMLGEDQYKTFKAGKPKASDIGKFFEAAAGAAGVTLGE